MQGIQPGSQGLRAGRGGYSLPELVIAMAILIIVVGYVMNSFSSQHKTYSVNDQVMEVQQNLRAVSDLLESEVRMSGFLVPDGASICGVDNTNASDELFVTDTSPIDPGAVPSADLGARVTAGYANGTGLATWTLDSSTVDLDGDGNFFYDTDADGTADADFQIGAGFILTDLTNPDRGTVCGTIEDIGSAQARVDVVAGGFDPAVAADQELVMVPAARYHVATGGRLMRNGDLLSIGIDDFQVSYFFDVDGDGLIDTTTPSNENPGTVAGGVYDPTDWDVTTLRQLRFNVVAVTRAEDEGFTGGGFQLTENRSDPGSGADGFRRRVYTSIVRPRNIGIGA